MAKQALDEIKKELNQEEKSFYGDQTESGSSVDNEEVQNEDTKELLADATGDEPKNGKPFDIGTAVNKDEKALWEE